MITYCKNCKHVIKHTGIGAPWLCRDTAKRNTLGIDIYLTCKSVNDDFKCSRYTSKFIFKIIERLKNEKV